MTDLDRNGLEKFTLLVNFINRKEPDYFGDQYQDFIDLSTQLYESDPDGFKNQKLYLNIVKKHSQIIRLEMSDEQKRLRDILKKGME